MRVRTAPAARGGAMAKTKRWNGRERSALPPRRALRAENPMPIARASSASPIQMASQERGPALRCAAKAAKKAVAPTSIPPMPGTAVKEPAFSMVLRIKRRLSIARSCRPMVFAGSLDERMGRTAPMGSVYETTENFAMQSFWEKYQSRGLEGNVWGSTLGGGTEYGL